MTARDDLAERLKSAREAAGLTQQQVANWLGVRRPAIAEIESGKRSVRSDELVRLANLYGRSLGWLVEGELRAQDNIAAALFRADSQDDPALRREAAILAKRCAAVFGLERKLRAKVPVRAPEYTDRSALEDRSQAMLHGKQVAYQERARLGIGDNAPLRDAWGVVEDAGIRVFPLDLGDDHVIDGIFTRNAEGHACVGVNVGKWVFRQVFTVVHEYGHALMDSDLAGEACTTSKGWSQKGSRYANRELRANQFAAVFLVPREALLRFLDSRGKLRGGTARPYAVGLSAVEIVRAQDHFGASGDMILWRLQNERLIDAAERKRLKEEVNRHGTVALARSLGYDFRRFAQPFYRAHEVALRAYTAGEISLGGAAEIFGLPKDEMRKRLRDWGVEQEYEARDVLVGGGV
jgi:Zn-dependent peptidase ImmA (M78 family)/transcriptional regulator with XRE-family HTH domain